MKKLDQIKVRDHVFEARDINSKRRLYISTYKYIHDNVLKKNKVITHVYFKDRIKVYDIEFVLAQQLISIEEFLLVNKEFTYSNSIFYLIIEIPKGTSFTPDFKTLKLFTKNKFDVEKTKGIIFGQVVGILPKFYVKLIDIFTKGYFGFNKGEDYEIVYDYESALEKIKGFHKITTEDLVPKHIHSEII